MNIHTHTHTHTWFFSSKKDPYMKIIIFLETRADRFDFCKYKWDILSLYLFLEFSMEITSIVRGIVERESWERWFVEVEGVSGHYQCWMWNNMSSTVYAYFGAVHSRWVWIYTLYIQTFSTYEKDKKVEEPTSHKDLSLASNRWIVEPLNIILSHPHEPPACKWNP